MAPSTCLLYTSRGNYEGAYEVAGIVLETREQLKRLFHAADSRSVIFSPGVTYSLNYFIQGFLKSGDHVIVTGIEHNAVMRPLHPVSYTHLDVYKRQVFYQYLI